CRMPVIGPLLVRGLNGFAWPATWMAVARPLTLPVKHGFLLPYDSWLNRIAVLRFVEDIPLEPTHPSRPTLQAIEKDLEKLRGKPMFIAWGMRDFCFSPVYLAEWRRRFPEATVREFSDAGHYLLEDAGAELVQGIGEFLAR
ncbi:MAG TPA: alpha/beta fold hydrolase, partial [Opitutales bacterium]|nr:alpha/beta fold hydrolase [Opitutales bacterium]